MKILNYKIKNIRGISELEGQLDGKSVYVLGKNGQGKSSFIQAIFLACKLFGNKPYVKLGEEKGKIELQIGKDSIEYTIERAFTSAGDSVLTIKNEKGKVMKSISDLTPQKWLDKLIGTSMYYLSEFLQMDPKKQVALFKEWFKIDTTELDKRYLETYHRRTDEGREETRLKNVVEGYHYTYDDQKKYAEKKDITEISKELVEINQLENDKLAKQRELDNHITIENQTLAAKSLEIESKKTGAVKLAEDTKANETQIRDLEFKITQLKDQNESNKKKIAIIEEDIKVSETAYNLQEACLAEYKAAELEKINAIIIPEKTEIEEKIKKAEEHNVLVDKVAQYSKDLKQLQAQEKIYSDLSQELKEIEKEKLKKLEDANIPVPGLTFDENSLIYEDKPLVRDVINDAKITEVLLTLLLRTNKQEADKGVDKLSIFRLNGGELTDSTFNQIMEIVEQEGGEVFVEIPDDDVEGVEIRFIEETTV